MNKLTRAKARDAVRAVKHKEYTTPLLAKELGISPRKVQSMIERGYIKASVQAANGHPSKRIFNEDDLKIAKTALLLQKYGFKRERIFLSLAKYTLFGKQAAEVIQLVICDLHDLCYKIDATYRGLEIEDTAIHGFPIIPEHLRAEDKLKCP